MLKECEYFKEMVSKSKDLNKINEKAILGLIKIIFELIGERPDNWELDKVNNKKHWKLNKSRQIMYIQTNKQKAEQFIKFAPVLNESNENTYNKELLRNKLFVVFNKDYQRFLEWLKVEHSDKYNEII